MGSSNKSSQTSASQQQSQTSYDPELKNAFLGNLTHAQGVAATPFQPYTGQLSSGFDQTALPGAVSSAQDLTRYSAPTVGTAANVSQDQINHYLNPFIQSVVDTTGADIGRQTAQQIAQNQGAATAAGAFGGSRHGVVDALTNEAAQRTLASTSANLRSQGFNTALGAGQTDLSRLLSADQGNQNASLAAAGVRANATGILGQLGQAQQTQQQSALDKLYQQWQLAQQYPMMMQQLLNQSAGLLPNGTIGNSSGTSTGTGSSSGFTLGPSSVSISGS
jgi:hypothetical protein